MPTVRAAGVLLSAAAIVLPGCAGPRVAEEAPSGVNLAGARKLDHGASDDPQKTLDHMRAEAFKIIARQAQQGPSVTEEYGLSPDGKELVTKLHISSGELPAVTLMRVYRPTDESAPHQLPTSD